MRYYKTISDGYIISIGTGGSGVEITASEYSEIMSVIKNKPEGDYVLKEDLTWEAVTDVTGPDEDEEDITPEEIVYALEDIL